tara:strand:- start:363 stop:494 length:132 start_codon:yes stop_codon:yes gene_type:complete
MVSQHELGKVVEQVNSIIEGLVKRIEKLEKVNTTKATKSKEKS